MSDKQPRGRGRGRGKRSSNQNIDSEKRIPGLSRPEQEGPTGQCRTKPGSFANAEQQQFSNSERRIPGLSRPKQQDPTAGVNEKNTSVVKQRVAQQFVSHNLRDEDKSSPSSNASNFQQSPSSDKKISYAPHPGFGIAGRPISLFVNHFTVKCNLSKVYHYYVDIFSPNKGKSNFKGYKDSKSQGSNIEEQQMKSVGRKVKQEVFSQLLRSKDLQQFAIEKFAPIYDGCNNVFTSSPLPNNLLQLLGEYPFLAEVNDKKKSYLVCLQKVMKRDHTNVIDLSFLKNSKKVDLNDVTSDASLALNAVMNHRGPESTEIRVGRSFFSVSHAVKKSIGDGLEIWKGYNQTIHLTEDGLVLVSNLSARLFHKAGPAIDYINELLGPNRDVRSGGRKLSEYDIVKIGNALKGVRIYATHSKFRRKYWIDDNDPVSKLPASDQIMSIDGKRVTIADYFKQKYTVLKYPHLHCFHMRTTPNNLYVYIPFENCEIVENQPRVKPKYERDLPPKLAAKMIKETAVPPVQRFKEIENYVHGAKREASVQMHNFNLSLDLKPKVVEGRVIERPTIGYTDFPESEPNDCGTWVMKGKFIKAFRVESWSLLNFDRDCEEYALKKFTDKLISIAVSYGLLLGKYVRIVSSARVESLEKVRDSQFIVIVLPRAQNEYNKIKLKSDCELGLVSQCVLSDAVLKCDYRTLTNICLKINVKLGGINHHLVSNTSKIGLKIFFSQPVIVFGADVVHSIFFPSIASVVGSLDAYPSKYKVCCRVQENTKKEKQSQEVIKELQKMAEIIFREFKKTVGKYPEKIIFYRDGVSEGQFKEVFQKEILAVQKAAKEVFGFLIKITFIIVQKRHQTRLKPVNRKESAGREGNVPAGTVVDQHITYPNTFDYFLCSHEGIKGTSKPARYTVLHDDNKFTSDNLQSLTYHLCHTFARCNRSVSIPAPVKYADLAAYRAKKYADLDLSNWRDNNRKPISYYKMSDYVKDAINNMHENKNEMFYI